MKNVVAVFDFDGTLRNGESGIDFIYYSLGFWRFGLFVINNFFRICAYLMKINDEKHLITMTHRLFKNKSVVRLQSLAEKFSSTVLSKKLNQTVLQRLYWHQQQNHYCVLLSRSFSLYLQPWAKRMKFDCVIATELEIDNGLFSGNLIDGSCNGEEKKRRLLNTLEFVDKPIFYMYGDSVGDKAVLDFVDFGYVFYKRSICSYQANFFN